MKSADDITQVKIPEKNLKKWQDIINIIARLVNIPAALIMRRVESDIEVFVSSHSSGNPYTPGDREHFMSSGLYCETVINTNNKLHVPNALTDEHWKNNPDVKLNMIAYLGYPITFPDGNPFGTICILDKEENFFSETIEELILNFRDIIESHLELIQMNMILGEKNKSISDYLQEVKALRGILPICSFCKKIRDRAGDWNHLEAYISDHSEAEFSHSICEHCMAEKYPNED